VLDAQFPCIVRLNAIEFFPLRQNLLSYLERIFITPHRLSKFLARADSGPVTKRDTHASIITFQERQFEKNSYLTTFHYKIEAAANGPV
jgi:hypothetical protein